MKRRERLFLCSHANDNRRAVTSSSDIRLRESNPGAMLALTLAVS